MPFRFVYFLLGGGGGALGSTGMLLFLTYFLMGLPVSFDVRIRWCEMKGMRTLPVNSEIRGSGVGT
jgi:hypothetical protein